MIAALQGLLLHAGSLALVAIFLIVALESSAFFGLFFPGEVTAIFAGVLAAAQSFSLTAALVAVAAGAIAGDMGGYALGRYQGRNLLARWTFARRHYERHRDALERLFERWGSMTVFVGRFVAVGRVFTPFVAGLSRMPARRFVPMAVLSGMLWGGATVMLGYLLGANWRLVERLLRSLGAGIVIVIAITVAMVALWRWAIRRQAEIAAAWRRRAERYGIDLTPFVEFVRARLSPTGYLGLHLTVGLVALGAMAWLFGGITQDIFAQDPLVRVDRIVASFAAYHRTPALDIFMRVVAFLGGTWWLVPLAALSGLILAIAASDYALAITTVPILAGAYGLSYGLQALFSRFIPLVAPSRFVHGFYGFPSVMLTAATAVYGAVCFAALAHSANWRLQTLCTVLAIYLIVMVGLGALYAGELLSTVIAGFALGGFWLAICLTGYVTYERLRRAGD